MPTVVTVLALRAAWKDHRDGRPAFLGLLIKDPGERNRLFQQGLKNIGRIFIVAIVLDTAYQLMVFRWVYPGMVLVVAVLCAIVPYVLVRGPLYLLVHFLLRKARGAGSSHFKTGEQMKLKPGPTRRVHAKNTRGAAFCGLGAFVGIGKTQRAHVYTAATLPVGPDDHKKIDPEKLARELEVDKCAVNSGRFWMMDEVEYAERRHRRLSWRQDELGRRHDRCRDDRPVPERVRALAHPTQHQLDLPRRQTAPCAA